MKTYLYIPKEVLVGICNEEYAQVTSEEVQVGIDIVAVYKSELDRSKKEKQLNY